jgi:hypothetical protein
LVSNSLHAYWDNILDISVRRERGEKADDYINRVAALIMARHPRGDFEAPLGEWDLEKWAREGLQVSQTQVYSTTLERGKRPSESYRKMDFATSSKQMALAGYRLANMLNLAFVRY